MIHVAVHRCATRFDGVNIMQIFSFHHFQLNIVQEEGTTKRPLKLVLASSSPVNWKINIADGLTVEDLVLVSSWRVCVFIKKILDQYISWQ